MAVSVNDRYIRATASGSQTTFTYDFPILLETDITIQKIADSDGSVTTLVLNTDYTLTGVGDDSGGTFVLTSGATADDVYVAYGNTPYARATDFSGATDITTDAINADYNEEEKQIQQNNRDISRSVRIPLSDDINNSDVELPTGDNRKLKYMRFSSDGKTIEMTNGTTATAGAGGSDTEIQYNSGDTLDGISGWKTPDGTETVNATGQFNIDNLRLDGNTISSTDTNGNVVITPDGDGVTDFSNKTTAIWFPVGTTAERPSSPSKGWVRFNTDLNVLETWSGSSWIAQSGGSGDVTGPGSSTDNAIARFDGTGGTQIQNSGVIIDDSNNITGVNSLELADTKTIVDENGNKQLAFITTANAVNYMQVSNKTTGNSPVFSVEGDDTNIPLNLQSKGTGKVVLVTGSASVTTLLRIGASQGGLGYDFESPTLTNDRTITLPDNDLDLRQFVLLDDRTISSNSAIDFSLPSDYRNFYFEITEILPATTGKALGIRTSTDGGSTFDSGSTDYAYACHLALSESTSTASVNSTGSSFIKMTGASTVTSGQRINATIHLFKPSSTNLTTVMFDGTQFDTNLRRFYGGGYRNSAADVDAIRFQLDSGNMTSGNITMYGIQGS